MAAPHEFRGRWNISDVLDRTDLSMLLDELGTPSTRVGPGRRWHCPMPDHDDHRASVTMHRDGRGHERWRCWSGDHRGDAVDLVMAVTNRDRSEAVDWLAQRAGMVPDRPMPPIKPKRAPVQPEAALVMDPLVERYVHACARIIDKTGGRDVRNWLRDRGIHDDTIRANLIGADPGRSTMRRGRGLPHGIAVAATFPVFDPTGNLTYVQARYLDPDTAGRKYDNPSAALAPHPRLGYAVSPVQPRQAPLLVCEGMPDALIAAQAGFQAVGLLGAHTPDDAVAARLANYAANLGVGIALVCDPDPAGRRVAETLRPLLAGHDITPTAVEMPDGMDLNAWALSDPGWVQNLSGQLAGPVTSIRGADRGADIEM
jgi:DNA primase